LFAVVDSECDDGNAGDTVVASLLDARNDLIRATNESPDAVEKVLTEALQAAHRSIEKIPKGARGYGGGASVTAFSACGDVGIVAHVGDCRLYVRQREGWIRRTEDHTLLEQKRAHGIASTDPMRELGIITRVVGFPPTSIDTPRFQIAAQTEVPALHARRVDANRSDRRRRSPSSEPRRCPCRGTSPGELHAIRRDG
jgi:serine/threonine protein phosphatase PrpC